MKHIKTMLSQLLFCFLGSKAGMGRMHSVCTSFMLVQTVVPVVVPHRSPVPDPVFCLLLSACLLKSFTNAVNTNSNSEAAALFKCISLYQNCVTVNYFCKTGL